MRKLRIPGCTRMLLLHGGHEAGQDDADRVQVRGQRVEAERALLIGERLLRPAGRNGCRAGRVAPICATPVASLTKPIMLPESRGGDAAAAGALNTATPSNRRRRSPLVQCCMTRSIAAPASASRLHHSLLLP